MVLVKHMWIAYCGAVYGHGRGGYSAKEFWGSTIRRVKERVLAGLSVDLTQVGS